MILQTIENHFTLLCFAKNSCKNSGGFLKQNANYKNSWKDMSWALKLMRRLNYWIAVSFSKTKDV
jgi:hypothetical protein